jgi:branched-chain amino acid transport system ATP-binding protein
MMLLEVKDLVVGYRKKMVLRRVSLDVGDGEIVGVIGHNGAGKTTLLKALFGLLSPWGGAIVYQGKDITKRSTARNVKDGISFMPQGQGLFPDLMVMDNLQLGEFALGKKTSTVSMEQVFELFPILKSRRTQKAGTLSGGEQRMLSLGLALMQSPKLLLLDEPSIGLAPVIVQNVMETVAVINNRLKTGIVMVEQNIDATAKIVNRIFIIKVGEIVFSGSSDISEDKRKLWELF